MAITSRRTGLIKNPITPAPPRTGLIWMMDAGTGVVESNTGGELAFETLGDSLGAAGNRVAERKLPRARNTRQTIAP